MLSSRVTSKLKLVALALVLVVALGGVLHETLIRHTLADLDHGVNSKTCAVCQALQHDAGFVSGTITAEPVLMPERDAYIPFFEVFVSLPTPSFASRAPPVLS